MQAVSKMLSWVAQTRLARITVMWRVWPCCLLACTLYCAAQAIQTGAGDTFVAGGVESMTRAPFVLGKADSAFSRTMSLQDTTLGWRFVNPRLSAKYHPYSMGETAENVAERTQISREEQDAYALRSHQRAVAAQHTGRFAEEIVPVPIPQKKGEV